MSGGAEAIDGRPGRRRLARALERQPGTGQITEVDPVPRPGRRIPEVRDILAIDVVFTKGQRLQSLTQSLRALDYRGHRVGRQVERGFALAVEAPSRERGAIPGQG